MSDPIVLTCQSRETGELLAVGYFDDLDTARAYVCRHLRRGLYSVWTPRPNDVINAASMVGLSMPPKSPPDHTTG